MLRIKCDINLQYLKTVDLHFVKSEYFSLTWSCGSRQRDTTSRGWKFRLNNLAVKGLNGPCWKWNQLQLYNNFINYAYEAINSTVNLRNRKMLLHEWYDFFFIPLYILLRPHVYITILMTRCMSSQHVQLHRAGAMPSLSQPNLHSIPLQPFLWAMPPGGGNKHHILSRLVKLQSLN